MVGDFILPNASKNPLFNGGLEAGEVAFVGQDKVGGIVYGVGWLLDRRHLSIPVGPDRCRYIE
jgi:hypothetical protein